MMTRTEVRIVGEDEAAPSAGTISYVSPFAQAVMGKGKSVGDVVQIADPEPEILAIE
jgi:transcription elongation GreA/GreB family factor